MPGGRTATRPNPGRPKNTCVREDQILPHLAAIGILHAGCGQAQDSGAVELTGPAQAAGLIDRLRASGITLTYDPDTPHGGSPVTPRQPGMLPVPPGKRIILV